MPHYYSKDGVLIDTLQGKNGKVRNTTVKDARELNLYPSVTELLKIFDKPALNKWKVVQGIKTCLNLPCNDGETTEDWIERIYKKSGEISDDAKDFGSTIHGMIEGYLKGLPIASSELDSFWLPIKTHLDDNNFKGETEIAVVTPTIGFGGKLDFVGSAYNTKAIVDFKTQKTIGKKTANIYDEWSYQLAGYRFFYPDHECYSLVISSDEPGKIESHHWERQDIDRAWAIMKRLVEVFSLVKDLPYSWWSTEGLEVK